METRKMLTILVLALGLVVCLAQVSEAVPMGTAITYQGRLIDANSTADGLYDFAFKLYDANVGGSKAANDVNVAGVDVIDGYFTVELDFDGSAFNGDARWLEIGVRPGELEDPNVYTLLSPRQEVTPTPYALYAKTAGGDNDWMVSGNDMYSIPSGNVGIGTSSPSVKLDVNGDININSVYKIAGDTVLAVTSTNNTLVGVGAGENNTGDYGTFVGQNAGYNNQGNFNTFLGSSAGRANTAGYSNTFLGRLAGYENTTGRDNTFLGVTAGRCNTEGNYNTFLGEGAGYSNQTGSGNVFIGMLAGFNETGSDKLYIANKAADPPLIYGDFSSGRVGIGTTSPAAKLTVDGAILRDGSTMHGSNAHTHINLGTSSTTGESGQNWSYATVSGGYNNTASSLFATVSGGYNNTASNFWYATVGGGADNTASNFYATVSGGYNNTASDGYATVGGGQNNTASIGNATVGGGKNNIASYNCATVGGGSFNTASGGNATVGGGWDNIASGFRATVPGGRLNTAGGDYSFAAGRQAKVRDAAAAGDLDGDEGTFVWADSTNADFQSTGPDQFLIRASGGVGIGTTSPSYRLDVSGDIRTTGDLHVGHGEIRDTDGDSRVSMYGYALIFRNSVGNERMRIMDAGNVGIGTPSPGGFKLAVNGSAAKPGGGSWSNFSDIRLKKLNGSYERGLSEVSKLNPILYSYKENNELELPSEKEFVGVVSQEVQTVIPEAVEENDNGYLMVNNDPVIWAMVNAIKELKTENEALKQRIEALETSIRPNQAAEAKEVQL